MGLFDGVKDAFSAPALERSTLDAERETPIDRWMGWSVSRDAEEAAQSGALALLNCSHPLTGVLVYWQSDVWLVNPGGSAVWCQ